MKRKSFKAAMWSSAVAAALMLAPFAQAKDYKYTDPLHPGYYTERLKEIKGVDDGKIGKSDFMKYHEKQWGKMAGRHRDMRITDHKNPLSPHYSKESIDAMDTNKDGVVSAEEYMKAHEAHWKEWSEKGLVDSKGYIDHNNPLLPSYKPH